MGITVPMHLKLFFLGRHIKSKWCTGLHRAQKAFKHRKSLYKGKGLRVIMRWCNDSTKPTFGVEWFQSRACCIAPPHSHGGMRTQAFLLSFCEFVTVQERERVQDSWNSTPMILCCVVLMWPCPVFFLGWASVDNNTSVSEVG